MTELNYGIRFSIGLHTLLIVLVFLSSAVLAPKKLKPYIPTLRVDLVALPDQLKSEKAIEAPPSEIQTTKEKAIPTAQKKTETKRIVTPTREGRLKNALNRIKSLVKLNEKSESTPSQVIKGNKVSKGSSISDDARENGDSSYLDDLRNHLQKFWALPIWLSRQKYSTQILVFIDPGGRIKNYRITKSSGNQQFDDEVKRTLDQSQPLPRPPANSDYGSQGITVGFPL